jgi:hypothetical protein
MGRFGMIQASPEFKNVTNIHTVHILHFLISVEGAILIKPILPYSYFSRVVAMPLIACGVSLGVQLS